MSMNIVVGSAVNSPASHGWAGMPTATSRRLTGPIDGSKIRRHIMPTATGVATSGMRIAIRTHFSPRNGRHRSKAMPRPNSISKNRTTTVNEIVRPTAGQNRWVSVRMSP